jgi:hypothetical protein
MNSTVKIQKLKFHHQIFLQPHNIATFSSDVSIE